MEVPTLTRSWSVTAVFEPSHAVRAVTVAKRREYTFYMFPILLRLAPVPNPFPTVTAVRGYQ